MATYLFNIVLVFLLYVYLISARLIDLDSIYDTNELYDSLYNDTMEWGTYKPNLFFGLK